MEASERAAAEAGPADPIRWAAAHPFAAGLGALALTSLFFLLFPQVDIALSSLFYDPASGFLHKRMAALEEIREAGRLIEQLFAVAALAPLALKLALPERPILIRPRATLFVLLSLALGPGLLVNGILKEYWGRARPRELLEFGGDASFSRVWWISDQCGTNCSFVSGEAAGAFWLVALVFIVPKRWRLPAAAATLALAAAISFTRIAMGGHFVSDVLIAWLLVLLVMIVLNRLILTGLPPGFDEAVERALAAPARALRRRFALRRPPPTL
jgi:membrane-associated PAP2 superfamily phosphatase